MFRHVGIVVKDLKKQLDFYQEKFDFEIYYHKIESGEFLEHILGGKEMKGVEIEIIKLGKNNNIIIELLDFKTQFEKFNNKIFDLGYTHFAITVENIDKLVKNIDDILSEPRINPEGTFKVCFCKDPEGNFIELVECISNQE